MDSLKGWEQRLEVWFGKYLVNSQRGPQHCIFLSSLIEKYQNKELDRFVSFLWVPVEKKLFLIHTVRSYCHSTALYRNFSLVLKEVRNWIGSCLFSGFQLKKKLFFIHTVRNYSHSTAATEFVTSATEFVMSSEASNQQYFYQICILFQLQNATNPALYRRLLYIGIINTCGLQDGKSFNQHGNFNGKWSGVLDLNKSDHESKNKQPITLSEPIRRWRAL